MFCWDERTNEEELLLMTMLILREEIVCMIVILFIIFYTATYKIKDGDNSFMKVLLAAFGHVLFDAITVVTVNNQDVVPGFLNKFLHLMFYFFGILFVMEFYDYIVRLMVPHNRQKLFRSIRYIPFIVFLALFFVLPIEYLEGRGTEYSYGPLVFAGYGIFVVYCIVCLGLVLYYRTMLDFKIRYTLFPMLLVMIAVILTQAFIPELLMTGAGVTFVCLGLFASFNNPAQQYREQALWDAATGIKNKNGYQKQMELIAKRYAKRTIRIGFLVGDMNGLKVINDNYGHAEGDKLIRAAATVLNDNLTTAHDIFRVGGDEFVAIYFYPDDEVVEKEMLSVMMACEEYKDSPICLSIAMGYASGMYSADYLDIYNQADEMMYGNKVEIKKKHPELCGR